MFGESSDGDVSDDELRELYRDYSSIASNTEQKCSDYSVVEQKFNILGDNPAENGDAPPLMCNLTNICSNVANQAPPPPLCITDGISNTMDDGPPPLSMGQPIRLGDTVISNSLKANVIETGTTWIRFLNDNQRKVLSEAKRKIVAKFNIERDAFRAELAEKMKSKLEMHRVAIDVELHQQLQHELEKFAENHVNALAETKKKQWCKVCLSEAQYACCWNTAYCGVDCQGRHWPMHQRVCRRVTGEN